MLQNRGKTAIFFKLLDGGAQSKSSLRPTQASMIENEALMDLDGASKPVRVIDCPGHLRLRPKLFSSLADCCAVVFVIDSTTFVSQGDGSMKDVAHPIHQNTMNAHSIKTSSNNIIGAVQQFSEAVNLASQTNPPFFLSLMQPRRLRRSSWILCARPHS